MIIPPDKVVLFVSAPTLYLMYKRLVPKFRVSVPLLLHFFNWKVRVVFHSDACLQSLGWFGAVVLAFTGFLPAFVVMYKPRKPSNFLVCGGCKMV